MATIKCINQDIIDRGATINLNATLSNGEFAPAVVWPAGTTEAGINDLVDPELGITLETKLKTTFGLKTVQQLIEESENFELI